MSESEQKRQAAEAALVPESPWLRDQSPARPAVEADQNGNELAVSMEMPRGKAPRQWLVRVETASGWKYHIVPGGEAQHTIQLGVGDEVKSVSVAGVSRLGRLGKAASVKIGGRN